MEQPQYRVGTKFKTRGRHPRECTVIDIWKTYNTAGELVRIRYVATHEIMSRLVIDYDVLETTIAMGLLTSES